MAEREEIEIGMAGGGLWFAPEFVVLMVACKVGGQTPAGIAEVVGSASLTHGPHARCP
jgi:hypothetical protein